MIKKTYVDTKNKPNFPGCAGTIRQKEITISEFYEWLKSKFTGKIKVVFLSPMTHGFNGSFVFTKDFDLSFENDVVFLRSKSDDDVFCFSSIADVTADEQSHLTHFESGDFDFILI